MLKNQRQNKVEIYVIIQKIGQIDTKNETFYAEFFVETKWTDRVKSSDEYDPLKNFNPNITLSNSLGDPYQEISYKTKILDSSKGFKQIEVVERRKVQGKFWQKFDFNKFPMDVQTLVLEISSSSPSSQVQLIESRDKFNFLNSNAFMDKQEWKIYNHIQTQECVKKSEFSSDEYSTFSIQLKASRMPSYYLYNAFLLISIITSVGLTRFTVPCDTPQVRLIIDTTVVLTLITFKWVIAQDIPQISYLTSLDKYILFSIVYVIGQSIYDSVMGVITLPKCAKPYGNYDLVAFIVSISALGLANLVLLIWIIINTIRNRFEMYKHTKESSNTNSQLLYQMYNRDLTKFDSDQSVKGQQVVDEEDSDTGSVGSQTMRL